MVLPEPAEVVAHPPGRSDRSGIALSRSREQSYRHSTASTERLPPVPTFDEGRRKSLDHLHHRGYSMNDFRGRSIDDHGGQTMESESIESFDDDVVRPRGVIPPNYPSHGWGNIQLVLDEI